MIYTDGSVTMRQCGWGFTVKQGGRAIGGDSGACKVTTYGQTMEVVAVTHFVQWLTLRTDADITHVITLAVMNLLQKQCSLEMICPKWHEVKHSFRLQ